MGSLITVVVSVTIAIAALLVAVSRDRDQTSASNSLSTVTPVPSSSPASVETSAAVEDPVTPDESVPSTAAPSALSLAEAEDAWVRQTSELSSNIVVSNVALVDGFPMAASTMDPSMGQSVALWTYGTSGFWEITGESTNAGWTFDFVDALTFADVTEDGSAELLVQWYPNDYVGDIFSLDGGGWERIGGGQALRVEAGALRGVENLCVPSCSDGFNAGYTLQWDGAGFSEQYVDPSGDPIELSVPVFCQNYTSRAAFGPYRPCDKGDGVELIQEALVFWGFLADGPDARDGYFGQSTADAVRLAQLWFGEPVDGIVSSEFYDSAFLGYLYGFDLPPPNPAG